VIAPCRQLAGNDGRVPVSYDHIAKVLKTSKSTIGRVVDVGETIAWLAQPGSDGVNGQTVRVCGQSLIGA